MIPRSSYEGGSSAISRSELRPQQQQQLRHCRRKRRHRDNDLPSAMDDCCRPNNKNGAAVLLTISGIIAVQLLQVHIVPVVHGYSAQSNQWRRWSSTTASHHRPTFNRTPIDDNRHWRRNDDGLSHRERSTRRFVLTTPEAIIEQASTTKLLDDLIDESVRTSARRPLMMQFDPSSGWIWKRWKGTVFSETWDACVYRMIYAGIVFLLCKSFPQTKELLSGFSILWGQLLSVTTFTLTFFVNQSYALWRKCTELSRTLQGRLHDMDMTLAAHATRMPSKNVGDPSKYTAESKQILEVVGRYVRLFNLFTYASFTRSHRPVLTPRGMRRLVERGLMTPLEREVLVNAKIPATQRHNAVLLWILRTFIEGTKAGHFTGGAGFEQQFIEKAHVCRAAYGAIGDELQGRMPLAYAHIVQVLVDLVLALYPFMAYSAGMSAFVCVIGTGLLTIGYQGLVWYSTVNIIRSYKVETFSSPANLANYFSQADLAKQFLDPYDNENYGKGEDPLVVDTLIAETNAGSTRWMDGLAEMPVAAQRIIDGELSDYILPRRGYTVEELQQMLEEQKIQKVKREKEELERQKKKELEELEKSWAEAMIPGLIDINPTESYFSGASTTMFLAGTDSMITDIPETLLKSSISMAEMVNTLTFSQNSNATTVQKALVPEGTVPIISFNVKKRASITVSDVDLIDTMKNDHIVVEGITNSTEVDHHATKLSDAKLIMEDFDNAETIEVVAPISNQEQLHTIAETIVIPVATNPVLDSEEVYAPNTIEYYQQKIQEILDARKEEDILLTRAIVMAPFKDDLLDDDDSDKVTDDTLVPSIPSIDASESDSVEVEPTVEYLTVEEILEAEMQEQWETHAILNARPGADSIAILEEEVDLTNMVLNSTNILPEYTILSKEPLIRKNTTDYSVPAEVLHEDEHEATESVDPASLIVGVLEELLETEAILNAPPGANSIEVSDEGLHELFSASNITDFIDDLAVLEMDDPENDAGDDDPATGINPDLTMPESTFIENVLINPVNPFEASITPFVDENDSPRIERR